MLMRCSTFSYEICILSLYVINVSFYAVVGCIGKYENILGIKNIYLRLVFFPCDFVVFAVYTNHVLMRFYSPTLYTLRVRCDMHI